LVSKRSFWAFLKSSRDAIAGMFYLKISQSAGRIEHSVSCIVRREARVARGENKKPILFENRLKFNPKMFIKISSPPEVDLFIPKI
jgi:hypothetical protein